MLMKLATVLLKCIKCIRKLIVATVRLKKGSFLQLFFLVFTQITMEREKDLFCHSEKTPPSHLRIIMHAFIANLTNIFAKMKKKCLPTYFSIFRFFSYLLLYPE